MPNSQYKSQSQSHCGSKAKRRGRPLALGRPLRPRGLLSAPPPLGAASKICAKCEKRAIFAVCRIAAIEGSKCSSAAENAAALQGGSATEAGSIGSRPGLETLILSRVATGCCVEISMQQFCAQLGNGRGDGRRKAVPDDTRCAPNALSKYRSLHIPTEERPGMGIKAPPARSGAQEGLEGASSVDILPVLARKRLTGHQKSGANGEIGA